MSQFVDIRVNDKVFCLKKITPFDFIDHENGVPFTLFTKKVIKTRQEMLAEQLGQVSKEEEKDLDTSIDVLKCVLKASVESINKQPFDIDVYFTPENVSEALEVFGYIAQISLKRFSDVTEIPQHAAIMYYETSQRFGKTPIDIICPDGDYTELDAFLFNRHILSVALEREVEHYKKVESDMKKSRRKARAR